MPGLNNSRPNHRHLYRLDKLSPSERTEPLSLMTGARCNGCSCHYYYLHKKSSACRCDSKKHPTRVTQTPVTGVCASGSRRSQVNRQIHHLPRVDHTGCQWLGVPRSDAKPIAMVKYEQVTGIPGTATNIANTPGFNKSLVWSNMGIIRVCHVCHKTCQVARDGCIGRRKGRRIGWDRCIGVNGCRCICRYHLESARPVKKPVSTRPRLSQQPG